MRIIIAGCGEMGFHLSKLLAKEEHDIVIIDKDPDVLAQADILDVISIVGSATSYKVLEKANIKTTDLLIAGLNVVIMGFGDCGKGVAERAYGMGAKVTVVEPN